MKKNIWQISLLIIAFIVYSCSSIFSKRASLYDFLSFNYIFSLGGVFLALATYAVLWQKVLTFMPLNKAFLFKSITILFILFISHFMYFEDITIYNMVGSAFIIMGLVVLSCKK